MIEGLVDEKRARFVKQRDHHQAIEDDGARRRKPPCESPFSAVNGPEVRGRAFNAKPPVLVNDGGGIKDEDRQQPDRNP